MATAFACSIFIAVILANNVFHIEGRVLEGVRSTENGETNVPMSHNVVGEHRVRLDEEKPNAFRPTTPGNSPGMGHSIRGQRVRLQEGVVKAFQPTSPGNSPGIGHSIRSHRVKLVESFVGAFRPTSPGNSPGIGHSKHD